MPSVGDRSAVNAVHFLLSETDMRAISPPFSAERTDIVPAPPRMITVIFDGLLKEKYLKPITVPSEMRVI